MPLKPNHFAANVLIAVAAGPFFAVSGMADTSTEDVIASNASDSALSASVSDALRNAMGDAAKNLKVRANNGVVTISGWVTGPDQESQARDVAATVPETTKVFSHVRTWSSDSYK